MSPRTPLRRGLPLRCMSPRTPFEGAILGSRVEAVRSWRGGRHSTGVRFVLGLLDSSRVTLAVVFGIPLAIGVVVALGVRRRTPAFVLLAGSLVVAGIAVLSAWAVFQPARQQASGSTVESSAPGAGGSSAQQVSYSCTPSGTRLQETVKGITYQKNCLAAPAD